MVNQQDRPVLPTDCTLFRFSEISGAAWARAGI
jgi:hypothetical protein